MTGTSADLFTMNAAFAILLAAAALYCLLVSRNLIRVLIGMELLIKAVTLLLAAAGYASGRTALAQAFIITAIVVEVVVLVVAAGIVVNAYRHNRTLDVRTLRELKG